MKVPLLSCLDELFRSEIISCELITRLKYLLCLVNIKHGKSIHVRRRYGNITKSFALLRVGVDGNQQTALNHFLQILGVELTADFVAMRTDQKITLTANA